MFEQAFKTQLASLSCRESLTEMFWNEIKVHYSESGRHYHTLSHLDNLLAELIPLKEKITDWQTLIFSIAYHDIIYDPLKNDNEEKSAEFAYDKLSKLSISSAQRDKCFSQIMATKGHYISDNNDTNFFTDADLAILGSGSEAYNRYAKMIRLEFRSFPDFVYRAGRQKVLQHFLRMPGIYKTDYFYDKYESQARKNISDELKDLSVQ